MPDFLASLQTFLSDQTGETVYALNVPRHQVEQMPARFILVRPAGGGQTFHESYIPTGDYRVLVNCYDRDRDQGFSSAFQMWKNVNLVLKQNLQQQVIDGLLLYWAKPSGGPIPTHDAETGWPQVSSTWQVYAEDGS